MLARVALTGAAQGLARAPVPLVSAPDESRAKPDEDSPSASSNQVSNLQINYRPRFSIIIMMVLQTGALGAALLGRSR